MKSITNSTNKISVCICVSSRARACVCVCVTQLSYKKNCKFKMSFFYGQKWAVSQKRESIS